MPARKKAKLTFSEIAYRTLKQAVLRGEIPEGTFLHETEVAKRYGIGRTPLREACNRLHQQQLVELVPRRGFMVRGISFREVVDLFEFRLMLEVAAAELAISRGSDAEIQELGAILTEDCSSIEDLIQVNSRFHLSIAQMSRNAELAKTLGQILERYELLSYAEARSSKFTPQSFKELHEPIVDGLRNRDVTATRTAVCRDILESQRLIFPPNPPEYSTTAITQILSEAPANWR